MTKVLIYGASDDLVEVEGDIHGADEYNTDNFRAVISGGDGTQLGVQVVFDDPAGVSEWTIRIENRYDPFPDWPIRFTHRPDREDDPAIEIDVPEKSTLIVL